MKPKFLLSDIEGDLKALQSSFLSDVGGESGPPVMMKYPGSDDTRGENNQWVKKEGGEDDSSQGPQIEDV
jgi:hypothetical protein